MQSPLQITVGVDLPQECGDKIAISVLARRDGQNFSLTFGASGESLKEAVGALLHDLLSRPETAELLPPISLLPRTEVPDIGRSLVEKYPDLKVG